MVAAVQMIKFLLVQGAIGMETNIAGMQHNSHNSISKNISTKASVMLALMNSITPVQAALHSAWSCSRLASS